MADLYNATARLLEPLATVTDLESGHSERTWPETRCSLRDLSAMRSIGALGAVTLNGYTLRLQTTAPVVPGWRVKATIDGSDDERMFVVLKVDGNLHKRLTLEGT